ncbi:hypothetical protein EYZ11_012233 [Aspergillus tanneri]|uniref:Uncharacterized protein n=1 Tax=Aspergillus tanneri TaxID=1220188 RepID=A0A4S3J0S4_9EURO|nr:hypothetical protein EYZ11_012233 [Aspergillus tanneri]
MYPMTDGMWTHFGPRVTSVIGGWRY